MTMKTSIENHDSSNPAHGAVGNWGVLQPRYASPMKRFVLPFLLVLAAPLVARAESEPKLSAAYSKCIERAGAVDPKVLECIGEEFTVQDRRLNASYRALSAKLTPERRKQWQDVQRAWLKYAESNCYFYYDPNGGTATRMISAECSVRARASRAQELEYLAMWQ
jgi:uncharacterized protein YecT (DUF1311 family)